jgi:hypothetical protein
MNIKQTKILIIAGVFFTLSLLSGATASAQSPNLKCAGNLKLHSDNLCWEETKFTTDPSNPDSGPICQSGSYSGGKCLRYAGFPQTADGKPVNFNGAKCPSGTEFHSSDGKCWEVDYAKVVGYNQNTCKGTITGQNGFTSGDVTGEAHWDNGTCWVAEGYQNPKDPVGYDPAAVDPQNPNAGLNYCDKTYVSEGKDNQTANRAACDAGRNGANCATTYAAPNQAAQKAACEAGAKNPGGNPSLSGTSNTPNSTRPTGECGGAKTNLIDCKGSGSQAISGVLKGILFVLTILIGIVATGGIVYGAVLYASAQDNAGQVGQAKTIIRDVAIGLLLYGFMIAIINWLVPGGVIG